MSERDRVRRFFKRHPHHHLTFFQRPYVSRRQFFQIAGAGVTGSFLLPRLGQAQQPPTSQGVATQNTAKNVIFILLAGAISHTDTFDLKVVNGVTPTNFAPATVNGINWPMGLLPKIGALLPNLALVRSMQAHALVHTLAQHWTQIGRNPAAALGNIAPNIGSVVSIEKTQPGQLFPAFIALNSGACVTNGYFPATYAPFKLNPLATGIPNTTNPDDPVGAAGGRFSQMYTQLQAIDGPLRTNSPYGKPLQDYNDFYTAAQQMMYNKVVDSTFAFSSTDSARYGSSSFGNACLVAKQVLAANQGTRFILITNLNWDMHQDIYGQQNPKGNNLYTMGTPLDNGYSALLTDLQTGGLLNQTMVVMVGEFGRTVGPLSAAGGRDHWLQQSAVFAGAGVKGGRAIGSTTADGSATADPGWGRGRSINPEDIEATIYSALGIDWTTVRHDDPFGRGFEYVPFSDQNLYGPINELWGGTSTT
ncbi:MAG TPA: DUF1501 domain-containing protein [Bryobacteraceae bacterium]|nr:DUF1501 domain-containing protein [Bryobacteraceae bacterium]